MDKFSHHWFDDHSIGISEDLRPAPPPVKRYTRESDPEAIAAFEKLYKPGKHLKSKRPRFKSFSEQSKNVQAKRREKREARKRRQATDRALRLIPGGKS